MTCSSLHSNGTSAIKVQSVTVESSTQTSEHSSPRVSAFGSALFSDGNKTDSFASSDALPDDIDRLFDRASFSIHGGSIRAGIQGCVRGGRGDTQID